jgi:hypothetical protein
MHRSLPPAHIRILLVAVHLLAAGVLLSRPGALTVLASIGVVGYALVLLRPVLTARTTAGNGVVKVGVYPV